MPKMTFRSAHSKVTDHGLVPLYQHDSYSLISKQNVLSKFHRLKMILYS